MRKPTARSETLRLRFTAEAKHILQSAAAVARRPLSEFILDSALSRAEEILPNRQRFGLTAERWEAFGRALDAPPRQLARIARLLHEPSVFERRRT